MFLLRNKKNAVNIYYNKGLQSQILPFKPAYKCAA